MKKGFVIGLLIVVLIVIFVLQNTEPVGVTLFAWNFEQVPLAALLLAAVLLGIFATYVVSIPQMARSRKEIRRLRKELAQITKEKEQIEISNSTQLPDKGEV